MVQAPQETEQAALSVTQLTSQIKDLVETGFPSLWVAGEISNFSRPSSGHCYLTLKDDKAQIRAVIWRGTANRLKFEPGDGLEVICHGHLDVYAPRGSYQLVIDQLQPQGVGALELAFRKLREKLAAEGLFDPGRKRPLPKFPRRLAFVTSPTGAAIRDFLEVLRRRWSGVEVLVIPARVQGDGAADEIAAGIRAANKIRPRPDVLVVGRGGGSLEDLWCFNEEQVVRAIATSKIPTVSAVGHEIDISLSDMAADVRALTPSEAAEKVVPARQEIEIHLRNQRQRLLGAMDREITSARAQLESFAAQRSLRRPFELVHDRSRKVDEVTFSCHAAIRSALSADQNKIALLSGKLESLSPLGVLQRGYSISQHANTGQLIRSATQLGKGDQFVTQFAAGEVTSTVDYIST